MKSFNNHNFGVIVINFKVVLINQRILYTIHYEMLHFSKYQLCTFDVVSK